MVISSKLLGPDERLVVSTRTHVKVLLLPALVLIVACGVAAFLSAVVDGQDFEAPVRWAVWVLALLAIVGWTLIPFLDWLTTTYTVTDRRLITRSGIFNRRGHDIPLPRISDVASERSVLDRILGCGTLVLSDASEQSVRLEDVPHAEAVQLQIANMLHRGVADELSDPDGHRLDDGT